jgi:FMN phosphatase YigB (HAD superfamily)
MAGVALFDLDNTLVDRVGAFRRWANDFTVRLGLGPLNEAQLAWLELADADGYVPRREFLRQVRRQFALSPSLEALLLDYDATYPWCYQADPAVSAGLGRLRAHGWTLGIVTNGPPSQYVKVDRTGLTEAVDALCVSSVVGLAKPDPAIFGLALQRCARRRPTLPGSVPPGATGDAMPAGSAENGPGQASWMVGDSLATDIAGAAQAGLRTIWIDRGRPLPAEGPRPEVTVGHVLDAIEHLIRHG